MKIRLTIHPREAFREFIETQKRWCCLVVHRRAGKTFHSLAKLLHRALSHKRPGPPKRYAYIAPTMIQAKDIAWGYLKRFTWRIPGIETNESELKITFPDGMTIRLYSGENYERMRGLYFDGVVLDEPEDIPAEAWAAVIRPCLSDYHGWAIWIGTIKGKLGQWQRHQEAKKNPDWFSMLLRASESGIIPEEELMDIQKTTHPDIYAQEFECDPRVSRCAFTSGSMAVQEEISIRALSVREFGYWYNAGPDNEPRIVWNPSDEAGAMMCRWEQAKDGHRYLVSVDSASGADQTGGEDPDSHSILCHRAGHYNEHGEWCPQALVARNVLVPSNVPGGMCCWWAEDILEEQVWLMCVYYGAYLVPERNHDRGLIEAMRKKGIPIHLREFFNYREQQKQVALGWETNADTRTRIISRLEIAMRETERGEAGGGLHVRCPWILEQMRNFGTKPNGRMEALVGHDDDVISLAIGTFTIGAAMPYTSPTVERKLPPDLQRLYESRQLQSAPGTYS